MNLFTKEKQTDLEKELRVAEQGGRMGEGIVREFGMHMHILLYLKRITNKDLLYNTENSAQCCMAWEGSLGEDKYMYMYG